MFTNRLFHLFAVVVLLLTACAPNPSENPLPVAAWKLDGDGTASVGQSTLEPMSSLTQQSRSMDIRETH